MLLAFLVERMEIMKIMHENFYGWSLENINAGTVETKYTVEYINDKKTWEKFDKTEDIELYSKREYDNISEALTFYMTWFISDQCYDIKLWEQVFVNGEMVLEQMIEPQGNVIYNMRTQIDRDMKDNLYKDDFGNTARISEVMTLPYKGAKRKYKGYKLSITADYDNNFLYHVSLYETKETAKNALKVFSCNTWKEVKQQ